MRKIKLNQITLQNFKGVRDFTMETHGNSTDVYGKNATGKTTLVDAFLWLLFDKDSQGKKEFEIKTLDAAGKAIPMIDHTVSATLDIDGKETMLKRTYAEKWTKKRGGNTEEFTGHESQYWIDEVPTSKKDYDAFIGSLINETAFKILTSPSYFCEQMPWAERRKVLMQVCGDISDADVISSNKDLAELVDILSGRKLDDHRKVIAAKKTEINGEINKIPVRIDEANRALPDITGIDVAKINIAIAATREAISQKQQEIAQAENGEDLSKIRVEIASIDTEIITATNEYSKATNELVGAADKSLLELRSVFNQGTQEITFINRTIASLQQENADREKTMASMREKWKTITESQLVLTNTEVCPTCGQKIPEEQIEETRQAALKKFNLEKSEAAEAINEKGRKMKVQCDEARQEIEDSESKKALIAKRQEIEHAEILETTARLETIRDCRAAGANIGIEPLMEKKRALQAELNGYAEKVSEKTTNLLAELEVNRRNLIGFEASIASVARRTEGDKRIQELKATEKKLAAQYEQLNKETFLTEEFVRAKVRMIEEGINGKFKSARFKLFDQQNNGGVNDCCEVMYQGVPYSTGLNNAARINVGIDVINTLATHYGLIAPIFIDNAEAVVDLAGSDAQMIRLVVSGTDDTLRVEA